MSHLMRSTTVKEETLLTRRQTTAEAPWTTPAEIQLVTKGITEEEDNILLFFQSNLHTTHFGH